ncbi:MAG: Yip1 family protein [Bacillota bacterium]
MEMEMDSKTGSRNLFELIYGVLFDPASTFRGLADSPPFRDSVAILLILTIANALTGFIFFRATLADFPGFGYGVPDPGPWLLIPVVLLALIFTSLKYFLYGAVLHLLAESWGGRGTPKGTLTVYALAALPGIFLIPFELIMKLFNFPEAAVAVLGLITGLAVLVWGVVLLVVGLREVHHFRTDEAALTVFTPPAALIFLMIIFFVIIAVFAGAFAAATGL